MKERMLNKIYDLYNRFKKDAGKNLFPSLYRRPMFEFIHMYYNKKDSIGAEIGVSIGYNAKNILKRLPIKKLYLIDPYETYSTYYGHTYYDQAEECNKAKYRLRSFKDKTVFIKKKSQDAVDNVPDNLDFVYIDGNHEEEFVWRDIVNYWKKIRKDGVLGGHDYTGNCRGVVRAVDKFEKEQSVELQTKSPDWWMVKKHA